MGNRMNCVLIESGQSTIYFSRWGAPDVPAILLSGPHGTETYARAHTLDDELLDNVWAEGGILLDLDHQQLLFFGGAQAPYVRRAYIQLLRNLWTGWSVEWAKYGVADFAMHIGIEMRLVLDWGIDYSTAPIIFPQEVQMTHQVAQASSIISVRWPESDVVDYFLTRKALEALLFGPGLLDVLDMGSCATLPNEGEPGVPEEGAFLDVSAHRLWMIGSVFDPRTVAEVARLWPGWSVDTQVDGLAGQIALTGRDIQAVAVPQKQLRRELVTDLIGEHALDGSSVYKALMNPDTSPLSNQPGVTFGIGFFADDRPPMSPQDRRELLLHLLDDGAPDSDQ